MVEIQISKFLILSKWQGTLFMSDLFKTPKIKKSLYFWMANIRVIMK